MTFIQTVRNVMDNPAPQLRDTLCQENGTGDAIGIEDTIYGDEFVSEQGAEEPGHSLVNIREEERIMCQPLISSEKGLEISRIFDAAIMKQLDK